MSDNTTIFMLGYLRQTQWASALKEAKLDGRIDPDRVRELMKEQKEAFGLDTEYIEEMAKDAKLLVYEMKQDKV